MVAFDCLTVLELNLLVPKHRHIYRSHGELNDTFAVPRNPIFTLWALDQHMRDRRVMACLLHEDHRPIWALRLVRFPKHRVQRLLKELTFVKRSDSCRHENFESFKRVIYRCRVVQIIRVDVLNSWHTLKNRSCAHAFYRETNSCQIEVSLIDLLPNHFDNLNS